MKTETISYETLAKKVGDMILFNNHSEVDEEWYQGLIEQPLMTKRLENIDAENRQYDLDRIAATTDEAEKAKLQAEFDKFWDEENSFGYDRASVHDFEIYQTYAITDGGARFLINHTDQLVSYSEKLGLWFWHIGHYGTSWSGVYTGIVTEWEDSDEVVQYWTHKELTSLMVG